MLLADIAIIIVPGSITATRIRRKQVGLVGLAFPLIRVGWRLAFDGDVRPNLSILGVDLQPLFESWFGIRLNRINRAFRLANTTIDAFVRVDDEHVLPLVETVHRTHLDTVHVLAANAAPIDDVGQLSLLSSEMLRTARREAAELIAGSGKRMRRVTCVAAPVQPAHIHDIGLRPLRFDL